MKIIIKPEIAIRLLTYAAATRLEFSGLCFLERQGEDILVYDFVLLNVGSEAYTEIDPKLIAPLLDRPDRKNLKGWLHRHPVGSGIPGPENWSVRDEQTIRFEPLGSSPDLVKWSVSIVLTPHGWVGRIDNYVNGVTKHLDVEPSIHEMYKELRTLEAAHSGSFQLRFPTPEEAEPEDDIPDDCDGQCDTCNLECEFALPPGDNFLAQRVDHPQLPGIEETLESQLRGYYAHGIEAEEG